MLKNNAIGVVKTGAVITVGGTSARIAIPTSASGAAPAYVRLAATSSCYAKIGNSSVAAAAGDLLMVPGDSVILKTLGQSHIAAIQVSAAGVLQVSPLEDA